MSELIKREDAIKATYQEPSCIHPYNVLAEVRDRIKALPAASPWHRVEEPPKPHEYVLCCGKKGGCFVGWTLDNADVVKANGHGRAFVHGGNARTFTHWMPLPEPPKEDA